MSSSLLSSIASTLSGAESAFNANSTYGMMNGLSQTVAALATVAINPMATDGVIALNAQAATMTIGKMLTDHKNGNGVSAADAIALAENMLSIAGAVAITLNPVSKLVTLAKLGASGVAILAGGETLHRTLKPYLDPSRSNEYHIVDPLVLDLNGDGIELVNANGWNGVQFDFNGNGIKTATQWVKPDDGLLVWDRNGNGIIDDGSELFGEDTPTKYGTPVTDGFSALQTVESHPDGEINAKDREWKNLKVWWDLNQDGETQKGELFSLDKLRISANNEFFAQYTTTFQAA